MLFLKQHKNNDYFYPVEPKFPEYTVIMNYSLEYVVWSLSTLVAATSLLAAEAPGTRSKAIIWGILTYEMNLGTMKKWLTFFALLFCVALFCLLDRPLGALPALGRLLDPVNGSMANAENLQQDFRAPSLKGNRQTLEIGFEENRIPHIKAVTRYDAYFAQGYIHAYFRLWQMDLQTRAAAGRISELMGIKALQFDRNQRRKGMIYAAENSLKAMEQDPDTKEIMDAYTAGVNAFIGNLSFRDYPVEYKLMGFSPELWTNLKSALLLKYMADDLTGYSEDFENTVLLSKLGKACFDFLYPDKISGSIPVIPESTIFDPASLAVPSVPAENPFVDYKTIRRGGNTVLRTPDEAGQAYYRELQKGIGSNNWAVSGRNTQSGSPILCNDPHLGLNLPSLWFQMQLQTPELNTYGVSLPGAPGIIIGYNDSISWGFTNNYRDVKDYYLVRKTDDKHYAFDAGSKAFEYRVEAIKIKDAETLYDTVLYTLHGPVQYDPGFPSPFGDSNYYAMAWMAHRPTNELKAIYELNKAGNYLEFCKAIQSFECPAQNFIYADRRNNIALWGQGRFVNKWKEQGKFVMRGDISATLWGEFIPVPENPHAFNPQQGYLASANQNVSSSRYPYWYNGDFSEYRSWRINQILQNNILEGSKAYINIQSSDKDLNNMAVMQNDDYSLVNDFWLSTLNSGQIAELKALLNSNSSNTAFEKDSGLATTLFIYGSLVYQKLWEHQLDGKLEMFPCLERSIQLLQHLDSLKQYPVFNNSHWQDLNTLVTRSWQATKDSIAMLQQQNRLQWYAYKATALTHLSKLEAFSIQHIKNGGWGTSINAMKAAHGPSWRMLVEMRNDTINAYGIYPGGQSGNPGSPYYASFVGNWTEGQYRKLLLLPKGTRLKEKEIKYIWTF